MGSIPEPESGPVPEAEAEPESPAAALPEAVSRALVSTLSSAWSSSGVARTAAPEPEAEGVAEPVPEWSVAIPEWSGAWDFHTYGLASVFAILGIVSFILLLLIALRRLQATRLVVPILAFLTLLGATRAIFLYGDAYGSRGTYPLVFLQLMYGLTLPCLTSAYALLIFSVLRALHPTHSLSKGNSLLKLSVGIAVHFVLSVAADIVIGLKNNSNTARVLVVICYSAFVLWGMTLFLLFSLAGWTLRKQLLAGQRLKIRGRSGKPSQSSSSTSAGGYKRQEAEQTPQSMWRRHARPIVIIGCATACGVAVVIVYIYGMVVTFDSFSSERPYPRPWPWWAYQTASRLLEVGMSWLILYATVLTPGNQVHIKEGLFGSGRTLSRRLSRLSAATFSHRPSSDSVVKCRPAPVATDGSTSLPPSPLETSQHSSDNSGGGDLSSSADGNPSASGGSPSDSTTPAAANQICIVMDGGGGAHASLAADEIATTM